MTDLDDLVDSIAAEAIALDRDDAAALADWAIDHLIDRLRKDPRMPRLGYFEWEVMLADMRGEITRKLDAVIASCDSPFDIAQRVKDELVNTLADALKGGKK